MTQGAETPGPTIEQGYSSSPFEPTLPPVTRLEDINLVDPMLYQHGDPHAAWKLLREKAPVFWHEQGSDIGTEGKGFWAVTGYDDTLRVLRDHEYFSSTKSDYLDVSAELAGPTSLICMDPPRQRQLRKVTQPLFTRSLMAAWEGNLTRITDALIDEIIEQGECDFAGVMAVRYPVYAASELLGLSAADTDEVQQLSQKLHGAESAELLTDFFEAATNIFRRLMVERADEPGDGIVSAVLGRQVEGDPMTDQEVLDYLLILFIGGLDSTAHAVTASLQTLFHYPEQRRLLQDNPDLWDTGIEELLRWTALSMHLKRYVMQDTELGGQRLRKGDYIAVFQPSANRDEAAFPDSFRFDATRRDKAIMTFGHGPHLCLGAHFARLELKVFFRRLLQRMPDIAPAGPMERGLGFTVLLSPIHHQPVTFTPGHRVLDRP